MRFEEEDLDRRRHKRFKVPADTFVILKDPQFRIGQIIDMSESGLGVFCVESKMPAEKFELDILLADDDYYVDRISVNSISEIPVEMDPPQKNNIMKRYSLQFADLTSVQKSKLACFFPRHGNGFIHDRRCVSDRRY